jgi:hypothetical protein
VNIDKRQIVQLLQSQGKGDQASEASDELPDQIDTHNPEHAGLLSKYGIDIGSHGGMPSSLLNAFPSELLSERPPR